MTDFLATLDSTLNPEQLRAVTAPDGPLLVFAGVGVGKTRVLTHRVAYLCATGRVKPREVFAVTFTNKAAGEMRSRVERLLGSDLFGDAWIGTFHSLAARMLRLEGRRLGLTAHFSIYDDDQSTRLVKQLVAVARLSESERGVSASDVAEVIERAKNRGAPITGDDPLSMLAAKILPRYTDELRRANALDFADLQIRALELLREHPPAYERIAGQFRVVLTDEAQDLQQAQYEMLEVLAAAHANVTMVGDPDQSIFSFRAASASFLDRFREDHPSALVVTLERNYRSTANILDAANSVIARNADRHPKRLRTPAEPGEPVRVFWLTDGRAEAELVAERIEVGIASGAKPEDFAILYRTNHQSRAFEQALRRRSIPRSVVGAAPFLERKEVKDVLAYLRLIDNPSSTADFARAIDTPVERAGTAVLVKLRDATRYQGADGLLALDLPTERLRWAGISPLKIQGLQRFADMMRELRTLAETSPAAVLARAVVERIRLIDHLRATGGEHADERVAHVEELLASIEEWERTADASTASTPLGRYLEALALMSRGGETRGVQLMSLHRSKSQEFVHVFVVGCEEGVLPSHQSLASEGAIAEERRLFYVGMTRAMKTLTITGAERRQIHGRTETRARSRFLAELPESVEIEIVEPVEEMPPIEAYAADERSEDDGSDEIHDAFRIAAEEDRDASVRFALRRQEMDAREEDR